MNTTLTPLSATASLALPAPFNEDGSNDPTQPTRLHTSLNTTSLWLQGTVSAADPDYFYIPIPTGMALSSLRIESFQSSDPVAFMALQAGKTFSAGTDVTQMLLARHIRAEDLNKNLLLQIAQPITGDAALWVNQTGAAFDYLLSLEFEVLAGPDIVGTDGDDTLKGTASPERLFGLAGDDTITGGLRADTIDGGKGIDTAVYDGWRENFMISAAGSGRYEISYSGPMIAIYPPPATEGPDTLLGIERVQFADTMVALDADGPAGQVFRIYRAAFDRTPDKIGLGYWMAQMDAGMDVVELAARFIDSSEFRQRYGSNVSNEQFIANLYKNVLERSPDEPGLAWWANEMKTNSSKSWQKVLADFSESAENKANVTTLIANGIVYDPWQ